MILSGCRSHGFLISIRKIFCAFQIRRDMLQGNTIWNSQSTKSKSTITTPSGPALPIRKTTTELEVCECRPWLRYIK
jgi:hypothetical protein